MYINIGNTNVVFGYFKTNNVNSLEIKKIKTSNIKNNQNVLNDIFEWLPNDFKLKNVIISSVVESFNLVFESFFKNNNINIKFIKTNDVQTVDLSNLHNPYELGVDILVQANYISGFFEEAIVLSAGTATVLYHIKDKKLTGCLILPGISSSIKNLENTTDIHGIQIIETNDKILGQNTNEAISIGLINMIETYIEKIKKYYSDCPVICSGGNSIYFKNNKWWFINNIEILGLFALEK